jgi:hypothetical protein
VSKAWRVEHFQRQQVSQSKNKSMPIEIKELLIRAAVSNGNPQQLNSSGSSSDILKLKKQITKEVTESVLKTLKQKSER